MDHNLVSMQELDNDETNTGNGTEVKCDLNEDMEAVSTGESALPGYMADRYTWWQRWDP